MTEYRQDAAEPKLRRTRRGMLAAFASVLAMLLMDPVAAQPPPAQFVAPRPPVSLQEAVAIATESHPGRVVRAVTVDEDGQPTHEVRILLDEGGRVVTVKVDARTGQVR